MSALIKAFILLSVFSVEVRIHAKGLTVASDCAPSDVGAQLDCHAMNSSSRFIAKNYGAVSLVLAPQAVFSMATKEAKIKWLKGEGVLKSQSEISIETSFGTARCFGACIGAFKIEEDRLSFSALKGGWQLLGFGTKNYFPLSEGGSIDIGLVTKDGASSWSQPYSLTKKSFDKLTEDFLKRCLVKSEIEQVRNLWKDGVERYSQLYQDRAERSIASHEENLERIKRARARKQAEDKALRELFRRKTLLD